MLPFFANSLLPVNLYDEAIASLLSPAQSTDKHHLMHEGMDVVFTIKKKAPASVVLALWAAVKDAARGLPDDVDTVVLQAFPQEAVFSLCSVSMRIANGDTAVQHPLLLGTSYSAENNVLLVQLPVRLIRDLSELQD
jgi:hypothetical protein